MNTKERILKVAEKLFLTKGIDRTSVRDIALKANINLAALNYHFKSKENLFDTIFEKILSAYSPKLPNILNEDLPLENKIKKYIDVYINILLENDQLPYFVISVINRDPKKVMKLKIFRSLYDSKVFAKQVQEEAKKGNIKNVNPYHLFINMLSLIAFPFAVKEVIMYDNELDEDGFREFIENRKKIIFDLLLLDLKCK